MWVAVDAVVVLGAHGGVLVVEEAVGTVALGVEPWLRLLCKVRKLLVV